VCLATHISVDGWWLGSAVRQPSVPEARTVRRQSQPDIPYAPLQPSLAGDLPHPLLSPVRRLNRHRMHVTSAEGTSTPDYPSPQPFPSPTAVRPNLHCSALLPCRRREVHEMPHNHSNVRPDASPPPAPWSSTSMVCSPWHTLPRGQRELQRRFLHEAIEHGLTCPDA